MMAPKRNLTPENKDAIVVGVAIAVIGALGTALVNWWVEELKKPRKRSDKHEDSECSSSPTLATSPIEPAKKA